MYKYLFGVKKSIVNEHIELLTSFTIGQAIVSQSHILVLDIAFTRNSLLQMFKNLCKGKRHVVLSSFEDEVFGMEVDQGVEKHIRRVST